MCFFVDASVGSIAAAVETAVTLLMGVGFLLALTAFLLAL